MSPTINPKNYIGKECAKHPELEGERLSSNSVCIGCNRDRARVNYIKNTGEKKDYARKYAANNQDKIKAYKKINGARIAKAWRVKNPDKVKAQNNSERAKVSIQKWTLKNADRVKRVARQWRIVNAERNKEKVRKWAEDNPEKRASSKAIRRATKLQATPDWGIAFFIEEAYALAKLREQVVGGKWHVDHIVPLRSKIVCGLHVEHNLRVIPAQHNLSKGNRHWPDMPA